ncbi:MAG: Phosphomannomutase/phosphoglucomutase [Bacteroidota bacterium]|jgi:phosphomannomutase
MALIKSISGIRGTIGGKVGTNLTPLDLVKFTAAFATWVKQNTSKEQVKIIIGRDARISGAILKRLLIGTLQSMGAEIIDIDLATTPTVELAVINEAADGGIILTASHNPKQWNALKLLNNLGEFLDEAEGLKVLEIADNEDFIFSDIDNLGSLRGLLKYEDIHIQQILDLEMVDLQAIRDAKFRVVVDAVNSVGGIAVPKLLYDLGVETIKLHCEPNGHFPHNPEPLPEHLTEISALVVKEAAHLGIVVDPDVDRLAFVCEDGSMFGEEYTLVAVADYILADTKGDTVSNLSSSRALRDITEKHGGKYIASAVGEVNVVAAMKAAKAVIGGEGNGGIIYPKLHHGRDALVGIALFLSHLAQQKCSIRTLKDRLPVYFMSKKKIELTPEINPDDILAQLVSRHKNAQITTIDGLKIDFETSWVHLRKSNTEAIIRIYTEAPSQTQADNLADDFIAQIRALA